MSMLQLNHQQLLRGVNCTFLRYLHKQINWEDRFIGIVGQRGVGKTTLLLQRIKKTFGDSGKVWYLSLDNLWFMRNTLTQTVLSFCQSGGTHLFLDNVHSYPKWMEEVGMLMDTYPHLHIVFAVSSVQPVEGIRKGLQRGVACYPLPVLSFREFLAYESILEMDPIPLDDLLANHYELVKKLNTQINIVPVFRNYLEHGCYPFYWQDPDAFFFRLQEMIQTSIHLDLPIISSISQGGADRATKLLMAMADVTTNRLRPVEILRQTGLVRTQTDQYINFLQNMGYAFFPEYVTPIPTARQKAFMGNTNVWLAMFGNKENRRVMAETFFISQMSVIGKVRLLENNDFLINDTYTFMVGDPLRDYEKIKNKENSFAAIYGLPRSTYNRMPVWILGFCY